MKTKVIILVATLLAMPYALAQSPSPSPTPEQQASPAPSTPAPVKYYLEIDQNDLNAISAALVELPKKLADPLILKLYGQLQKQDDIRNAAMRAEAAEPEKSKKKGKQ